MALRVFIASDHGGFLLKTQLQPMIAGPGTDVVDLGTCDDKSVDYPDYALALCRRVLDTPGSFGILICGTGIGMSMAANRIPGIRAALCTDSYCARMARAHNNANVLCLGGRVIGPNLAGDIAITFLSSGFEGGRHDQRIARFDACLK
jgi:ribose 5-phosphate isomerase B